MSGKPYGHELTVERWAPGSGYQVTERIQVLVRRKGPLTKAMHAAKLVTCFIRVVKVDVYQTEEHWHQAFGHPGRM